MRQSGRGAGNWGHAPRPARVWSTPAWGAEPGAKASGARDHDAGRRGCCSQPGEGLPLTLPEVGGPRNQATGAWGNHHGPRLWPRDSIRGAEGLMGLQCWRTPRSGRAHGRGAPILAVVTGDLNSGCGSLPWCRVSQDCAVVCLAAPRGGAGRGGEGQGTSSSPWPFKATCSHLLSTPKDVSLQGPLPTLPGILVHSIWPLVTPRAKPSFSPPYPHPWEAPQGATPRTRHCPSTRFVPGLGKTRERGPKPAPDFSYGRRAETPRKRQWPVHPPSVLHFRAPSLSPGVPTSPWMWGGSPVLALPLWWGHSREAPTPPGPASSCITGRPGSRPLDACDPVRY